MSLRLAVCGVSGASAERHRLAVAVAALGIPGRTVERVPCLLR
jgi:hypothetical protein